MDAFNFSMMKIKIKTLTQKEFELEVDEADTVLSLKEKLKDHEGFPVESQRLIYAGKILSDSTTLGEHGIRNGDALVVMSVKPAPKQEAPKPEPEQRPTGSAAETPNISTENATNVPSESGQVSEPLVKQLTDMGFPRSESVAALKAAMMNVDRAVEYLTHGIPDDLPMEMETSDGGPDILTEGTEIDDSVHENPLAFLMQQPEFLQMRALVQANPQSLQPLLEELGQANPDMLELINENQDAFFNIINDTSPLPGGNNEGLAAEQTIQVTPAESEAIERLMALGFDRYMVLEAYLACDKNEELAANYLVDNSNWG